MKRISSKFVLVVGICVLLGLGFVADPADIFSVLALPFTLLGSALRALSLSGAVGNIAAIALYVLVALLPLACKFRRGWQKEDVLLALCSALLFLVLYYMVNPSLRPAILQNSVGDSILSGVVYSTLLCWGIVKILRRCDSMGAGQIYHVLRVFLGVCAAEFAVGIVAAFAGCRADILAVQAANTMPGLDLMPTFVFISLSFAVSALEYALMIFLFILSMKLLRELDADAYSASCAIAAEKTALWCRRSLVIVTLAGSALQIAQILAAAWLHNLAVHFRFPVLSMTVAFALLALTRLLYQGNRLKEDNDLFI